MKRQRIYLVPLLITLVLFLLAACSHTHSFGEWMPQQDASCTENGREVRNCSCGESQTRLLPRSEHTPGEWATVEAPSCIANGLQQQACTGCGLVLQVAAVPAGEHSAQDWVVTSEPTCTADGLMHRVCADCGLVLQASPIPAEDHQQGNWITVAEPSCTAAGLKQRYCTQCDMLLGISVIPAEDHQEGEWSTLIAPSCTADGLKQQTCADCDLILRVEAIPATGHTPGEWIIDQSPTSTQQGSRHQECKRCGATVKTEKIPVVPKFLIVLDAGHGGKDPGAEANGVQEKSINLQIALKMKQQLEAQGIAVVLTRSSDVFLELSERAGFANSRDADLFVSVHCNSYDDASVSGFEVFYHQNSQAKAVASAILSDLSATGQVKVRSVKTAQYYVLKYTSMPAILLEMGFITNAQECEKLCSDAYQDLMVKSIVASIIRTLNQ